MSFYADKAVLTTSMLTKFGRTCQIITPAITTYNPDTGLVEPVSVAGTIWDAGSTTWDAGLTIWDGEDGESAETSTDVKAADFAMKGNTYQPNTNVQEGDRYALVNAVVDITVDNKIVMDGVTWSIIAVEKLAPSGISVMYKLHIRK